MRLTSTINKETRSQVDVPVLIIMHGGRNVFIPRPKTYDDLVEATRVIFRLDEDAELQFSTSTLDACCYEDVEIDAGAYTALQFYLDVLNVNVIRDFQDNYEDFKVPIKHFTFPRKSLDEDAHTDNDNNIPGSAKMRVDKQTQVQEGSKGVDPAQRTACSGASDLKASSASTTFSIHDGSNSNDICTRHEDAEAKTNPSDERFTLTVTGSNKRLQFRSRGSNKVRQIVATACDLLHLDPLKVELIRVNINEGTADEINYLSTTTLAQADIGPNAELVLESSD